MSNLKYVALTNCYGAVSIYQAMCSDTLTHEMKTVSPPFTSQTDGNTVTNKKKVKLVENEMHI